MDVLKAPEQPFRGGIGPVQGSANEGLSDHANELEGTELMDLET
jgi:hypothetical protein